MALRTSKELRDAAEEFRRLATSGTVAALRVALQKLADDFEEEARLADEGDAGSSPPA